VTTSICLERQIIRFAVVSKGLLRDIGQSIGIRLRLGEGIRLLRSCITLLRRCRCIALVLGRIGLLLGLRITLRLRNIPLGLLHVALRRIDGLLRLAIALGSVTLRLSISGRGSTGHSRGGGCLHLPSLHIRIPTAVILS